jgi:hypothetical protein
LPCAQPLGILVAVVRQRRELFGLVYVNEVVRPIDFAERLIKFFAVAPAVRLRPQKREPRRGGFEERRHVVRDMLGGDAIDVAVALFAPRLRGRRKHQRRGHSRRQ